MEEIIVPAALHMGLAECRHVVSPSKDSNFGASRLRRSRVARSTEVQIAVRELNSGLNHYHANLHHAKYPS